MEQHVRAVRRMYLVTVGIDGDFRIDDMRQRFVFDFDQFGGVFGECTRIGNHRHHPFAGVTRDVFGQCIARDFRRVDADRQRIGFAAEFFAGQYIMHAGCGERGFAVDRNNARAGVRRSDDGDVFHAGQRNVGDETAAAGDEARVFLGAAFRADVAETVGAFGVGHDLSIMQEFAIANSCCSHPLPAGEGWGEG